MSAELSWGDLQWPFDPSGFLYPTESLGEDVDHVTLLRNYGPGDEREVPGLHTAAGDVFEFRSLNTKPTPDLGKIQFEFVTTERNGLSYRFFGEFHNNHVFEEFVTDPTEIVASGKLQVFHGGKMTSEVDVAWTYSPQDRKAAPDVNRRFPSGKTPLIAAVIRGDLSEVRRLLAGGARVNGPGPYGATALEHALRRFRDSEAFVHVLISAGADVDQPNASGDTPLMLAAYRPESIELLISAGAKVNARSKDGRTALIHAVQAVGAGLGSISVLKALLSSGAEVNARDSFGRTALSIATDDGKQDVITLLIAAGGKE